MHITKVFTKTSILLLFFSIFFIKTIPAQNHIVPSDVKHKADSLISRFKHTTVDTTKTNLLLEIGNIYCQNTPDTALYYYNMALASATKANSKKYSAMCLRYFGGFYFVKGVYDKAYEYFMKSLKVSEEIDDKYGISMCYINIGSIYFYQSLFDKAIEYSLKSLKISEELHDKKRMATAYNTIGNVYDHQGEVEKAKEYYLKCLKIREELGDNLGISISYNNIGNIYNTKRDYKKALEYYFKSFKIKEYFADENGMATLYNNIGNVYAEQGTSASNKELASDKYDKALKYLLKSLKMMKEIGNKNGTAGVYGNLSLLNIKLKKYSNAIKYAQNGLEIAKEIDVLFLQKNNYECLSTAYDSIRSYKKSLEYYKLFKEINDSIFNEQSNKQIADMQTKYETEKKDKDIQLLNKDKQLQQSELLKNQETIKRKNTVFFFIITGFIIIVIAVIIILNQRRITEKVKLGKQLADLEHKALQLQMNPHFIFNSLNSISNYIAKNETETARIYMAMFAKLMRQVLENSRAADVSLQKEIDTLTYYLELEKMQNDNKFDFFIDVDKNIDAEAVTIPPMLIQPFVENSVIHGIKPKEGKGMIDIHFKLENPYLLCEIEDDGVGRAVKAEATIPGSHKSFATQITQERLKIINKNEQFCINYQDLNSASAGANKTGTLVSFKLLYKKEV